MWFELDDAGKQLWEYCRIASAGGAKPEAKTWEIAITAIFGGALQSTLRQTVDLLAKAETLAKEAGWTGLAAEMAACRDLSGLKETGLPI